MKVFLVVGFMEDEGIYYVASTHHKAWAWIKGKQMNEMEKDFAEIRNDKRRRPNKYLQERFEDPNNLYPYDIDDREVDEAWSA